MTPMRRIVRQFTVVLFSLAALGQDAGSALQTGVAYSAMKASLPLSAEQRAEADRLGLEAQKAGQSGRFAEAMRLFAQGTAVMNGVEWTPVVELSSSLQAKLDHALWERGKTVTLTLAPLYPVARAAEEKLSVSAVLQTAKPASETPLLTKLPLTVASLPFTARFAVPDSPEANYILEVRVAGADGDFDERGKMFHLKRVPVRIESVGGEVERLRARIAKAATTSPSAEYAVTLWERIDRGETSPHGYNLRKEFGAANAILDALDAGRNPLDGVRGDVRRAYRSTLDQTLQPYRLYIPAQYDAAHAAPLVVALHGMSGDENSLFDLYGEGALKREAGRLGFLVVCPKGRQPASMYRGAAERDVFDVIAEVRRDYSIDANRIYLMGHSMGAYATWALAMGHPDLFAALGPIAGGGNPTGMEKIRNVPQYVVHGDADKTVPVTQSRTMVEAARKLGTTVVYVEIPDGDHIHVATPQFGPMLDFFAKQSKKSAD